MKKEVTSLSNRVINLNDCPKKSYSHHITELMLIILLFINK